MNRRQAMLGMGAAAFGVERALSGAPSVQAAEDIGSDKTDLLVDFKIGDTQIQYLTSRFRRAGNFYELGVGNIIGDTASLFRIFDGDQAKGPFLNTQLLVTQPELVSVSVNQATGKFDFSRLDERYRIAAQEKRPNFDGSVTSFYRERGGGLEKEDFLIPPSPIVSHGFYQEMGFGHLDTAFIADRLWWLREGTAIAPNERYGIGYTKINMSKDPEFSGAYAVLVQHYPVTTVDSPADLLNR